MSDADALLALYESKALAELGDADALSGASGPLAWRGEPLGPLAVVVGVPSADDVAAGRLLSGRAGEAVDKALAALDIDPASVFVLATRPARSAPERAAERVRIALEAIKATLVVALDPVAAQDVSDALRVPSSTPGAPMHARGRTIGCVGDFAVSLDDPEAKRDVWKAFKTIVAAAGPARAR